MSIRRFATRSCWLAGAVALAFGSLAAAQAQEAAPQPSVTYSVLHNFSNEFGGARSPATPLTPAGDGSYYGTSSGVNVNDGGTVFKLAPDGSVTILYAFTDGADGANPGAVIVDAQGNLYGTTSNGGSFSVCSNGCGVLFKLAPDGTETVLHEFNRATEGSPSSGRLLLDANGNLYGATVICTGQGNGCGEIFKWAPDGTFTVLHAFSNTSSQDGVNPNGDLIRDHAGNLYGTTLRGGSPTANGGFGVIFKLAPDGTYTVLHRFAGGALEGAQPSGGLVGDQDGNLYGTTVYGGSDVSCMPDRLPVGCGTVFKLAPNRTLTTLYAFKNLEDGFEAEAPLYRSPRTGALFGTTSGGGPVDCSQISSDGCGTVFMVTPDGNKQTLHAFSGPDGYGPDAPLIRGPGAQLLGTAFGGGANQYGGVIYSLQLTE